MSQRPDLSKIDPEQAIVEIAKDVRVLRTIAVVSFSIAMVALAIVLLFPFGR